MTLQSLAGQWQVTLPDGVQGIMKLPGTLDESGIGHRDTPAHPVHPGEGHGAQTEDSSDAPIATRFTRKHTYEGEARISRRWNLEIPEGKRAFVEVERARCLRLLVDGREMEPFEEPTLVAPHVFEVTGVAAGEHLLTFISDNSYPGLAHDDIVYSSAATDETQTNWNGLLGYIRLRVEERVFLSRMRVYPHGNTVTVKAEIDSSVPYEGVLTVASPALAQEAHTAVCMEPGRTEVVLEDLPLALDTPLWEEEEGNLCRLTAHLSEAGERIVAFGVRSFGSNGRGRLALSGRTIFLRSEANCAVFPETGYCPMDQAAWENILGTYRSYGVNCVRFHSHCPPEAAFAAADGMGMFLQPELSHWNPRDAFLSEESFSYYRRELRQLLLTYANHPSFVMLTLGNELHTSQEGHRRMDALLDMARSIDDTRMYSRGSNEHYGAIGCGEKSDFYTSQKFLREDLRGTSAGWPGLPGGIQGYINHQYPHTKTDYSAAMKSLRQSYAKPVFSFEVGQFEVLPGFRELEDFRGVLDPANYRLIQKRVREKGLEKHWERYVEATGELARIGYREEIEAAMRTREMSGISLLGLQDFPGQGTALVGMLNAHLKPKPYPFAEPEAFHAFFRAQLPLVKLDRYTYEVGETLTAEVELANYGRTAVRGVLHYALEGGGKRNVGTLGEVDCPCGENTFLGKACDSFDGLWGSRSAAAAGMGRGGTHHLPGMGVSAGASHLPSPGVRDAASG